MPSNVVRRAHLASRLLLALAVASVPALAASCAPGSDSDEYIAAEADGPEPAGERDDAIGNGSVADAVKGSCETSSVKGLSQQIIAMGQCLKPEAYAEVPKVANVSFGANVFPFLVKPARDKLVEALNAKPNLSMSINSMLRTVAQQYLLYRWYQTGSCGIGLAAKPGNSNHETGLALDINEASTWKSTLQARGFSWYGSNDPVHYDYTGSGAKSFKGLDVQAFQHLWNLNNPGDKISEDGAWGPATEARLKKAPAKGFPIGADCNGPPVGSSSSSSSSGGGPACTHSLCTAGPALTAACDPCAQSICAVDAYCCSTNWDSTCVGEVATVCKSSCDAGSSSSSSSSSSSNGGAASWSCDGSFGTTKMADGEYYATAFGCWADAQGNAHQDPGDNCIPSCLPQAKSSGLCAGMSGPACERATEWFAADAARFGCLARIKVTNPKNGKSVVVVALDNGPSCTLEKKVSHALLDLSYPANFYLFGSEQGVSDKALVHVDEVPSETPLGPQ